MISEQEIKGVITTQELKGELGKTIEIIPPKTQEKSCTPTEAEQEIVPDEDYTGLSKVTVDAIPEQYVVPTGTLDITENGLYDIKSKENVNVTVGGAPKNADELNTGVQNVWNSYAEYLNNAKNTMPAYTEEPITLRSPANEFTCYYIAYTAYNQTYTIYWKRPNECMYIDLNRNRLTGWIFDGAYDYQNVSKNLDNEFVIVSPFTKQIVENGYQREVYLKQNIPSLEEAINCLKDPNTEYYHDTRWSIGINDINDFKFVTNDTLLISGNGTYNVCTLPCISHNETILITGE